MLVEQSLKQMKITLCSLSMSVSMLCLQPQQKQVKQVTPKKTQEITNEDEYAGSTDVDAPGLFENTFYGSLQLMVFHWKTSEFHIMKQDSITFSN